MDASHRYENFPGGIVLVSNAVSLGIDILGFLILVRAGLLFAVLYLIYILILEYRLLRYSCTNCYYWGKVCGFGKGKISSWLFTKGDNSKFCLKQITWKSMIPDLLVSLIPFVAGIILLIREFSVDLLLMLLILMLLTTQGNAYIRGKLTCRHCRQQELGCPADLLFKKEKNK